MQLLLLPLLSRTVLVTVVVPTGKANPLGGTLVKFVTAQLSVALTLKMTLLVHWLVEALTVIFPGQLIAGGWLSSTVTAKVHTLVLPLASVARLVTIVMPTGKAKPLTGTLVMLVRVQLRSEEHTSELQALRH